MLIVHIAHEVMFGGVGAVVRNLLVEQEKLGLKTALVTHPGDEQPFKQWAKAHKLSTKYYPVAKWQLTRPTLWGELSRKNAQKIAADFPGEEIIYHLHNAIAPGLFSCLNRPMLCSIHGLINSPSRLSQWLLTTALCRVHRKGGKLIAVSEFVAQYYMDRLGLNDIGHALNGVEDLPACRGEYIEDNGRVHIGFAANLDELKGWKYLAEAFVSLPESIRSRAELYLAGRVDPADQGYLDALLADNCDIHYAGFLSNARTHFVPDLDIMVLPSRTEALPMTILESFQSGVPVCATAVGGIPELVKDGETGLIIRRDAADIAEKLTRLIENPDLRRQMGKNARKTYENIGTSARMAENYLAIYRMIQR